MKDYLQETAYDAIKQKILTCEFAPGSLLTEDILKNQLGISRTPIREALIRLENSGLVEIKPKKGILVSKITLQGINAVFELRNLIEAHAVLEYGNRISHSSLLSYLSFFLDFDISSEDRSEFFANDDSFHLSIVEACPNSYMMRAYRIICDENNRLRIFSGLTDGRIADTKKEHADIIQACIENNWAKASRLLSGHFENAKSAVISRLLSTSQLESEE